MKRRFIYTILTILVMMFLVSCNSDKDVEIKNYESSLTGESYILEGYKLDNEDIVGNEMLKHKSINSVSIWQPFCVPCENELKAFENLTRKYSEYGFIGICIAETSEAVSEKTKSLGLTFDNYRATNDFLEGLDGRITKTPTLLVLDSEGREIFKKTVGTAADDVPGYMEYIESIIRELENEEE